MNTLPPPIPVKASKSDGSDFAHQAATACLAAPLFAIGLGACFSTIIRNHAENGRIVALLVGGVSLLLCGLGFVFGILSFIFAKDGQRSSIALRSILGFVLLGLLGAIAVPNFVRARSLAQEKQKALTELNAETRQFRQKAIAALTNTQTGSVSVQELQQSLARAERSTSGQTAVLLKCSQIYVSRIAQYQHDYEQASLALKAAQVLKASDLVRRDQLGPRRDIVRKFMDANLACKNFIRHEDTYSKDLAAAGIPAPQREEALTRVRRSMAIQRPTLVSVREADERIGQAMLGIIELLDKQWGQWKYDQNAHVLRFEDGAALARYNSLMGEINQAASEQSDAQKRLAQILKTETAAM
jgi:hypothetical protein